MRRLALLTALGAFACESEPPRAANVDVRLPTTRVGVSTSGTVSEAEPPEPLSLAQLVADGQYWRWTTSNGPIHVWIPEGYKPKSAATIVYVHGFYTTVDAAWKNHQLPAQFAASGVNAMFIACEAPAHGSQAVSWQSLTELLKAVRRHIGQRVPKGRLVAVGHSGAWRTLVGWLDEPKLDTVVLFDAAYGEIAQYRDWVRASPKRRLIDIGDDTKKWTEELHKQLPETLILDGFPPPETTMPKTIKRAQIVYVRSKIGHFSLVTGGLALPLTLRMLRGKLLLDEPLADILDAP